eukprot:UN15067
MSDFAPDLQFYVYDWDMISANDLIGKFSIPYKEALNMKKARWFKLYDADGDLVDGEVYVAVEFLNENQN